MGGQPGRHHHHHHGQPKGQSKVIPLKYDDPSLLSIQYECIFFSRSESRWKRCTTVKRNRFRLPAKWSVGNAVGKKNAD